MVNITMKDYARIIRSQNMDEIYRLADEVRGKTVKMVNSTAVGGGVAELLNRLVPLMNELGLDVKWEVIKGHGAFFKATKAFHNALHGADVELKPEMFEVFKEVNKTNGDQMKFDEDIVVIHDPQPAGLVDFREKGKNKWIWRCHIDVSSPNMQVWNFLKDYIEKFDASIFSVASFSKELSIPQFLIPPCIDPLTEKNRELTRREIDNVLNKFKISKDKPLITQISRFDYLKDPVGVIKAYRIVKRHIDCQLVLAGGAATDDPEANEVLCNLNELAESDPDLHILNLPPFSDHEINALQRASAVVLQKSLREGFGLTVAEALWKSRPVIAGAVGGIPLQVINNYTGILVHSIEGCAYQIRYLLNNPEFASELGRRGKEHVRERFLLPTLLRNYLLLFLATDNPKESIINL